MISRRKKLGQFFTPETVATALVTWAVRKTQDCLLDPSCGDGQFLACHRRAVGIEIDPENAVDELFVRTFRAGGRDRAS